MAPLTCSFGRTSLSPSQLLLLLFLSFPRVRGYEPTSGDFLLCVLTLQNGHLSFCQSPSTIKPENETVTTGTTAGTTAGTTTTQDAGGEGDVVEPEIGTGPEPTLPPDDIEVDNSTTIIVGCILGLLVVCSIAAVFWKFRSSAKTEQPEAPTGPAEFDAAELEPKGSVVE